MQHAEKGKKKVLKRKSRIFPHKLKRTQSPLEKKKKVALKPKAQSELYREARTAFNKYLYTKRRRKKPSKFPVKLSTVCGSLKQDQICNFYWNRSILLIRTKYKKVTCSSFGLPLIICVYQVWQHPYCIALNS